VIGIGALLVAAYYTGRVRPTWVEYLRASAAAYLTIVTLVYWFLLAPWHTPDVPWSNTVLHLVSGVIVAGDWLLAGPRQALLLNRLWVVLVYPAVWLTVILVREVTDGWVPYPFLDHRNGYASIAVVCGAMLVSGAVVAIFYFATPRWCPFGWEARTATLRARTAARARSVTAVRA